MTFKLGDIVKVTGKEYTYGRYAIIFKILNFKNGEINEWNNYLSKDAELFQITNLIEHPHQYEKIKIILYKIVGLITQREFLIDQRGLKLIKSCNFKLKII